MVQFPAGNLRDQEISQIVGAWNNIDSEAVENWALNLPAGTMRDIALKNFAEDIAHSSPEKAARIIELIASPSEQEQALEPLIRSWSESNPQSARNWLARLNVSERVKLRFQSLFSSN